MGIELQFLNLIQEIRTTFLDVFMSNVTKLGNVGFIWILLTIILLVIPKNEKKRSDSGGSINCGSDIM